MMKKSKLSIGLVTSFIGALALTACDAPAVTEDDKSIVNFIGYNSDTEKLSINIDEFYSKYGDSDEGTTLYYNAVLESLIRYEYKSLAKEDESLKKYETIDKEAEDKVKVQEQNATDNAKSNKTSYDEEWDKILESYDVEDRDELKEHFIYELEKEAINEWYYKKNKTTLPDEYIGLDADWNEDTTEGVDSVYPYHILHVLVKLSADAGDYTRATITEAEAKKLWSVVRNLMDSSYTFEQVAYDLSDDTSNTAYGDVGIMSINTSFYNEFKLGIYAYDALLSGVNKQDDNNAHIYEAFGMEDSDYVVKSVSNDGGKAVEEAWNIKDEAIPETMYENVHTAATGYDANGYSALPYVPYEVFRRIGEAAEKDKLSDNTEPESGDVVLPRNVLFNQFLNFRSPFVISDDDFKGWTTGQDEGKEIQLDFKSHDFTKKFAPSEEETDFNKELYLPNNRFKANAIPAWANDAKLSGKKVLADQEGNVIIGVRSTAGIHFMVMRKSIFKATNEAVGKVGEGYSLQDYYTVDENAQDLAYPTYVNMKKTEDPSYYTDRINTLKNKFKGADSSDQFDAAYDYRIYNMLLENVKDKITIVGSKLTESKIAQNIQNKIDLLREMHAINNYDSMNDAWASYLEQLRYQNDMRLYKGALVKTTCVFKFDNDPAAFEKGDNVCYVK